MEGLDLEQQRRVLEEIEDVIARQLSGPDDSTAPVAPDNAIGRLTRMEALQAQQIGQAGKRRLEQRLRNIRKALEAIDEGTYGTCVRCGDEVPAGRLQIMPEARLCVRCAARS